ncbi:MAG: NAD-dependent epimerase/dehydratase family protein [Bacteroidota bacterium]
MNVILTGATGMVGEGVLNECLRNPSVNNVLVIGRKECGVSDGKLTEIIHRDFFDLSPVADRLRGYDACFFCLGKSSVGMKESDYYKVTYTLTMNFARVLAERNPGMTFCYISGAGTDSSEKGKLMWARVKGKTENDLSELPFRKVYNFRPGLLQAEKGAKNTPALYNIFSWVFPLLRRIFPEFVSTLGELGRAMINAADKGCEKNILEVKDILALSKR